MLRLLLLCLFSPAFSPLLSAAAPPSTAPERPPERTYTMGVYSDNYPYSFVDGSGEAAGFACDLSKALERTMNIRFRRITGTTQEINTAMAAGLLDLLQTQAESEERRAKFAFSHPFLQMINSIIVRKGETRLHSPADLANCLVLVHPGSLGERYLQDQQLQKSIVYSKSVEQSLRDLNDGRGDAVIATRLTAISNTIRLGFDNIDRSGIPIPSLKVNYCFAATRENGELIKTLDEGLAILNNSGEYERIYRKWFGHIERGRYTEAEILGAISIGLGLAFIVSVLAMLRQRRLKFQIAGKAAELLASEERYRRVFESSSEGLLVLAPTPGLPIRNINSAGLRILRLERDSALGKTLLILLPEMVGATLTEAIFAAAKPENSPHFELELPFEQNACWINASLTHVEGNLLLALTDITEAHKAQERLQISEQQLRQAQKLEAVGTLASGIAHDFNNILTGIMGNAELAQFDVPPDHPAYPCITEILKGSQRARELTRQILTFSRRSRSVKGPMSLSPLVAEVIHFIRATTPASIQIKHLPAPESPLVEADATQLHQVLVNLCTNAIHAMRGMNGLLEVSEDIVEISPEIIAVHPQLREGRYVRISVRDTGCGMPPSVVRRIFEPFFTTKAPGEGTGLGLSVVHGIIEDHRGAITVYSQPGQGTVFRIHLPTTTAAPSPGNQPPREIPLGRGESILVVDDEPSIVAVAEAMLRRLGYRPLCFTRPQDAAAAFAENPGGFDLVVTDLTMPGLNGLELIRRLRQLRPGLPAVLASGYIGEQEARNAAEAGLRSVIPKPLSLAELAGAVSQALAQAQGGDTPPHAPGR